MKTLVLLFSLVLLQGCARFSTTQTDISTTYHEDGSKTTRTIITEAGSSTFFDSSSALAKWKATQSDKTQSASVGVLNQETSGTNTVDLIKAIAQGIAAGLTSGGMK